VLFFQGKLTSYESSYGLESSISKDGQDYADVNAEINTGSPSIQVKHLLNLTIVNLTRISGLLKNIRHFVKAFSHKDILLYIATKKVVLKATLSL
jgi:hypothetical protein